MSTTINLILTEDSTAGKAGDLVKVKMGYARNFLLTQQLAVVADEYNLKVYEERKAEFEKEAADKREAAEATKDQIGEDAIVTVSSKAGESGKLFGAITKEKIATALNAQHNVSVTKDNITIAQPIKELGMHKAKVSLGSNVTTEVTIKVENENS